MTFNRCAYAPCSAPLRVDGPSLYFCGEACQTNWNKAQPAMLMERLDMVERTLQAAASGPASAKLPLRGTYIDVGEAADPTWTPAAALLAPVADPARDEPAQHRQQHTEAEPAERLQVQAGITHRHANEAEHDRDLNPSTPAHAGDATAGTPPLALDRTVDRSPVWPPPFRPGGLVRRILGFRS